MTEEIAQRPFLCQPAVLPKGGILAAVSLFFSQSPNTRNKGFWNTWLALSCLETVWWRLSVQVSGLCGVWHCAETLGRFTQETGVFTVVPNDGTGNPGSGLFVSRELRPACTQPHIWLILCWFGSLSRIVSCLGATVVERTIILKYNNPCTGHFIQCSLYTSSLAPPSSRPAAVIDKAYYPVLLMS